ncbi:unnamed protein product, partial [Meganyctiphanes norvegica]
EPVSTMMIVDDADTKLVGAAGPYSVGERPTLTCRAYGGDPPPIVNWWRDDRLLDHTYHHAQASRGGRGGGEPVVENTIHLRSLKKSDLKATYTCKAHNHDLAPSKEAIVEIDMNFGPESVVVRGLEGPISAGRPHQVVCEAR